MHCSSDVANNSDQPVIAEKVAETLQKTNQNTKWSNSGSALVHQINSAKQNVHADKNYLQTKAQHAEKIHNTRAIRCSAQPT